MDRLHTLYYFLDLAGTFAFAISGATAAKQKGLDLFGICAIAFIVACGGGIFRDICIGDIPPAGLRTWYYLATSIFATAIVIFFYPIVERLNRPVLSFDAVGLSMFAVTGAEKALSYGHNAEAAVLLGVITAVGGGVIRDVLLNRVPIILQREIYASAALIGALIVVLGNYLNWVPVHWISIVALTVCFSIRLLSLRFHWKLDFFSNEKNGLEQ